MKPPSVAMPQALQTAFSAAAGKIEIYDSTYAEGLHTGIAQLPSEERIERPPLDHPIEAPPA